MQMSRSVAVNSLRFSAMYLHAAVEMLPVVISAQGFHFPYELFQANRSPQADLPQSFDNVRGVFLYVLWSLRCPR